MSEFEDALILQSCGLSEVEGKPKIRLLQLKSGQHIGKYLVDRTILETMARMMLDAAAKLPPPSR